MFKEINIYVFLFIWLNLLSCQADTSNAKDIKPEKVYRIVYEIYPNEWYQRQAELWKIEIEKNPTNEDAWYNYYNANRYAHFDEIEQSDRQKKLDQIILEMEKAIPNTFTYHLLAYWNNYNIKNMHHINEAYKINPSRPDTYYPFISEAIVTGNEDKLKEFCTKLYNSEDIAPWLLNYNYNVLMSTKENAILITNGDNDTYPIWVLQNAKNIRKDVTLLNISLLPEESYFKNSMKLTGLKIEYEEIKEKSKQRSSADPSNFRALFLQEFVNTLIKQYPETPLYFALTVYRHLFEPFENNLYVVGLAYQYSPNRFDNIGLIKKNLESQFRFDYLTHDFYGEHFPGKTLASKINMNYIAPIVLLVEHYYNSGENTKAEFWKNLAVKIAQEAGSQEALDEIHKKFNK